MSIWLVLWFFAILAYFIIFVRRWLLEAWGERKERLASKKQVELAIIMSEDRYREQQWWDDLQFQECEEYHLGGDCPHCGAV